MTPPQPLETLQFGNAQVEIFASGEPLGAAAAQQAATILKQAIEQHDKARAIVATGNSQIPMMSALIKIPVDWSRVEIFHMDEYVGLSADHPSSFRYWIRTRLEEKVHPRAVFYIAADRADLDAEMSRYARLLLAEPIDLAFLGFGENGHIAFNDPPNADFSDPATVKKVLLDEACRLQQVGEKHFPNLESVPAHAVTITCPGLFRANHWICCVPEKRKSEAVLNALTGPISEKCPASLVRRHPSTRVYLDRESASLLSL